LSFGNIVVVILHQHTSRVAADLTNFLMGIAVRNLRGCFGR
jgi:hypothetical protein